MSFFLSLLIALTSVAEAKKPVDPCAKSKVTTDAFTGETKTTYGAFLWTVETSAAGGTVWILKVGAGGALSVVLPKDWPVALRMEDGSTFELHANTESPPLVMASQYGVSTQWLVHFTVAPETVQLLATKPIVAMRFDTGQGPQTWDGNDAFRKNIGEAFGCAVTLQPGYAAPAAN